MDGSEEGSKEIRDILICEFFLLGKKHVVELQRGFPVAQTVKNLPAVQETRFNPWVRKIPLENAMDRAACSRLQSVRSQRVEHD